MRRIIFLDIDGVLNTQEGVDHWMKARGDIFDKNGHERFCPRAVECFNKIINATEAEIVITSHWRNHMSIEKLRKLFKERGVLGEIIDVTPSLDSTIPRGREIEMWMEDNGQPDAYVIIDDDCDFDIVEFFPEERCVKTNYMNGITQKSCYKRAINYLNRPLKKSKKTKENSKQNQNLF